MKNFRKDFFPEHRPALAKAPQFQMLFESIMYGNDVLASTPVLPLLDHSFDLLMEEIGNPTYVVSESTGNAFLLEDALFMDEEQIIAEGIAEEIVNKVKELFGKIKNGLVSAISKGVDVVKAFIERVKENKVVKSIREKLELDSKMPENAFNDCFELEKNESGEATEDVIVEEFYLNEKELGLDADALRRKISRWTKAANGIEPIKTKSGKIFTQEYAKAKLKLFKKRLKEVLEDENREEADDSMELNGNETSKNVESLKKELATLKIKTDKIIERTKQAISESTADGEENASAISSATESENAENSKNTNQTHDQHIEKQESTLKKIGNALSNAANKTGEFIKNRNQDWCKGNWIYLEEDAKTCQDNCCSDCNHACNLCNRHWMECNLFCCFDGKGIWDFDCCCCKDPWWLN